ncbi:DUF881 domain-containing protein [Nocardioides luteus]|uniref:DUF881 domain-containing protein n=1 Tax=Nocardioides luteus TaxID=1844 RepID=UPI000697A0F4|nr:DUF881 domain-containing protein [Nocardioides luteus]
MKRTAAKRTPAKKAPAAKPAEPVEETVSETVDETVADDGVTPEAGDEGTPAAEQASTGDSAEAPETDEPAEAPETEESSVADEADEAGSVEPDEAAAGDAAESEKAPEEPSDAEVAEDGALGSTDETDGVEEADEEADDEPSGTAEADEPAEPAEPAEADEPAESDEPAAAQDAPETDEVEDEPDEPEKPEEVDQAAEPEEEPAPLVGRARLFDALTHFRRGQAAVAVLLCVLGYAAVVQVQTNTEDSTYAGLREQELIDILSGLAGTTQKAQEQIEELESTRDELEDQTLQQQTALQRAEEQVDTLRVIAGTVPVSGPGVTIEIDPGPDPLRLTALLDLIEELRTSGAEAMEIEGADGEAVRLVASSAIEVSQPAPGLNVGGELISPPYRLKVIGPPDTLAGAIDFYQGPQDQLEQQGAEVKVESEEKIDIESIHTVSR